MKQIATTSFRALFCLFALLSISIPVAARDSTAAEIDAKVDAALGRLKAEVPGSTKVLAGAKGVLVFAEVIKAGFVIAGEGGEGALRIGGKTSGYYSIFSGSVGFQAGGQKRDIIMVFLDAAGKFSRLADAVRVRRWVESGSVVAADARRISS